MMDRVIQMVVRMFLNRGLRMLFRQQRRGRPADPQQAAADRVQRETAQRIRETQRLGRRLGR
jgi:hypothetical protein